MEIDPAWLDLDLYEVLDIDRHATAAEVTAAYRHLARVLHPDTNHDPAAEERFKTVSAAYDVLRDPQRRAAYDQARRLATSGARRRPGGGYTIRVDNRNARPGRTPAPADPPPPFGRDGRHLTLTVPVSFSEAALGADVVVPTVDGDPLTLRVPAGMPSGRVLRIRGRGAHSATGRGDLLVTVQVDVPRRLTDRQRDLIRQLGELDDPGLRAHLGMR